MAPFVHWVPSTCSGSSGQRLRLLPEHSRKAVMVRVGMPCRSSKVSSSSSSTRPVTASRHSSLGMSIETGPFERTKNSSFGVRKSLATNSIGVSKLVVPRGINSVLLPMLANTSCGVGVPAGVASCAHADSVRIEAITGAENPAAAKRPIRRRRETDWPDRASGRRATVINVHLSNHMRIPCALIAARSMPERGVGHQISGKTPLKNKRR
jgi:hypothetical protein